MLHIPQSQTAAHIAIRPSKSSKSDKARATLARFIDPSIQKPKRPDEKLELLIEALVERRDVRSICRLYNAFEATDFALNAVYNMSNADDTMLFLGFEMDEAWARAYYVAGALLRFEPDVLWIDEYCQTLFNCALAMGHNIEQATSVLVAAVHLYGRKAQRVSS